MRAVQKSRFTLADLTTPAALPTAVKIASLAARWGRDGKTKPYRGVDWHREWVNIEALAARFLSSNSQRTAESWYQLLMAVGNFKRQAGPIGSGVAITSRADHQRRSFDIPVLGDTVSATSEDDPARRREPAPWEALTRIPGLQVPTASTVLAALWPSCHFIFDSRVRNAVVALACGRQWAGKALDETYIPRGTHAEWQLYAWARLWLLATPSSLRELERGLYVLDGLVTKQLRQPWKWSQYAHKAAAALAG